MKSKFMVAFLGVLFFGLMAADVHAFCVYNQTDITIHVFQTSGDGGPFNRFVAVIEPNGKSCCHWSDKGCNTSGKRDGIVGFTISPYGGRFQGFTKKNCYNFQIQAGGWLTVEGSNGNYRCVRHDY